MHITVESPAEAEEAVRRHCQARVCQIRPCFHDGGGNLAPLKVTADTPDLEAIIRDAIKASADHAVEIHRDE